MPFGAYFRGIEQAADAYRESTQPTATPGLLEEALGQLREWVEFFDRLDRDSEPGDRVADVRRQVHGKRIEAARALLARAEGEVDRG